MLSRLWSRLRGLFLRRRAISEADEELAFHLEQETAAHVAGGMSLEEARRRARADLGAIWARDHVRDARTTWLDLVGLVTAIGPVVNTSDPRRRVVPPLVAPQP